MRVCVRVSVCEGRVCVRVCGVSVCKGVCGIYLCKEHRYKIFNKRTSEVVSIIFGGSVCVIE